MRCLVRTDFAHRDQFELYDMVNDPGEINNLAYLKAYAVLVKDFKSTLWSFMENTYDPWGVKWSYE